MNWGDARIPARFWDRVSPEPNSGCWFWLGARNDSGYGHLRSNGRLEYTHRLVLMVVGRDLSGLVVDHLCRNPACCNPAHLEAVPNRENVRRGISGVLTTTCPKGHPYNAANTKLRSNGHRSCRACKTIRDKARDRSTRGSGKSNRQVEVAQ